MKYLTEGPRVAKFAETYINQTKGEWAGKPLALEPYQTDWLNELFLIDPEKRRLVYKEALLGIPRKNGKSTLCAALGLYGLIAMGEQSPEIYSAASSEQQARAVFDQAKAFIDASPRLQDFLIPRRSYIECKKTNGIYRVLTSKGLSQHGLNPSMVIVDELHTFMNDNHKELFWALRTALAARRNPLLISITTAGYDKQSLLYNRYMMGKELEAKGLQAMRDARFYFKWFGAPEGSDIFDPEMYRIANPASWIDVDEYVNEAAITPEFDLRRLYLNQWTEPEGMWIPHGVWEDGIVHDIDIPYKAEVFLGIDIGLKSDTSAVVVVYKVPDTEKFYCEAHIFVPPKEDALDITIVEQKIRDLADKYTVRAAVYDRYGFPRSAQMLSGEGINMVQLGMTNANMVPATANLFNNFVAGKILHKDDPRFEEQVKNGIFEQTESGPRLSKRKAQNKIDSLIALLIAMTEADRKQADIQIGWL